MDQNSAENNNQAAAAPGLITVMVTPEQIKQGAFLLGRYDANTDALSEIRVVNHRNAVPIGNELVTYRLIGVSENGDAGQPLDDFVETKCEGWDGVNPITLAFNRTSGEYVRYQKTPGAANAATA